MRGAAIDVHVPVAALRSCLYAAWFFSACALPSRLLHRDRQVAVCFCAHVISQPTGLLERAELSFVWRPVAALRGHVPPQYYYYIRLILIYVLLTLLLTLLLILILVLSS